MVISCASAVKVLLAVMVFPFTMIGFLVFAFIKVPLKVYSVPSFSALSATLSVIVTFSFAPTT